MALWTEIDIQKLLKTARPFSLADLSLRPLSPVLDLDDRVEQWVDKEVQLRVEERGASYLATCVTELENRAKMADVNSPTNINNNADPNTLQEMVDDVSLGEVAEEDPLTLDPTQDPHLQPNLREISSLASWQVSTSKPNCGVEALRSQSPSHFWQSDGPQPHLLTLHFVKSVIVVKMRVYLDFVLDESYTPTRMSFWGGTSQHDLIEFATWRGEEPRGWVDVDLDGVGVNGEPELRAHIVQVKILENHQNGKDTHVRGVQVFARDERDMGKGMGWDVVRGKGKRAGDTPAHSNDGDERDEEFGIEGPPEWPEWMREPEIR